MSATLALGKRALREALRQPDALFMTFFIPIFFLIVNTGQAAEIFPSASTDFLEGQGYGAFQLPITLLLAASFGMAALFLVEEIEGGYFDKLRAIPIPRYSIVLGRLVAEGVKCVVIASVIVLIALPFGITIASGLFGFLLLVGLTALMGRRLRRLHAADRAQDAQRGGDELGRADLLPAAVSDAELRPARHAHEADGGRRDGEPGHLPDGGDALADPRRRRRVGHVLPGFAVVAVLGAVMLGVTVRMIKRYD